MPSPINIQNAQLHIVGTNPLLNVAPSVLLTMDCGSFLFNVGENMKRYLECHQIRIGRLSSLFFTRLDWEQWAGATDVVFQLAEGERDMYAAGGVGLMHFLLASRYFLHSRTFTFAMNEIVHDDVMFIYFSAKTSHTPPNMKIYPLKDSFEFPAGASLAVVPILIDPDETNNFNSKNREFMRNPLMEDLVRLGERAKIKHSDSSPSPNAQTPHGADDSVVKPNSSALCYALHFPPSPPKIDVTKAKALGISPGPLLGQLATGNTVVNANGVTVTPEMVWASPPASGPIALIIDCPTGDHLRIFSGHVLMKRYFATVELTCVVHLTPTALVNGDAYSKFIRAFPSSVQHLIVNRSSDTEPNYPQSQVLLDRLVATAPDMFSHPTYPSPLTLSAQFPNSKNVKMANSLSTFTILPLKKRGFSRNLRAKKDVPSSLSSTFRANSSPLKPNNPFNLKEGEVFLDIFGTGAADPSRVRNVTGSLLFIKPYSILLDCGAGTLVQMNRKYGTELDRMLLSIRCVWISHKHADHHCGLISILQHRHIAARRAGLSIPPVVLLGPYIFRGYLEEFSDALLTPVVYEFHYNSALSQADHELQKFFFDTFGVTEVVTVPVIHGGGGATAISIKHKMGWHVVLSGDTRPTRKMLEIGQDCTLLVHEASFCDADLTHARWKSHSTTTEALHVGALIRANFIVLSHFSQRHPMLPIDDVMITTDERMRKAKDVLSNGEKRPGRFSSPDELSNLFKDALSLEPDQILVAFDLMRIDLATLASLPPIQRNALQVLSKMD